MNAQFQVGTGGMTAPVGRVEDAPILSGKAQFLADIALANCLHAVFVRSPVARARLAGVEVEGASRAPGVELLLTGKTLDVQGWPSVNLVFASMRQPVRALLAVDRVDAVGEPVALVIARTELDARNAAELVVADYEPETALPHAPDVLEGSPIFADWPDNIVFEHRWQRGNDEAAFAGAARVVRMSLDMPRVAAVALEPRGAMAAWDERARTLTAWLPTQTPHRARSELARILNLPERDVRVITPCVGGAFGAKASLYPEDVLVAIAAMKLRRPVRWIATRNEDFLATSHGRGGRLRAEAAIDARGRFLALRANLTFALGYWATYSAAVPAWNAGRILPGPYRVDAVDIHVTGVMTNTAPIGILRGAGRPEAALIMERLMDEAARELRLDPADVRRTNLIDAGAFPYQTATAEVLDSGDYARLLSEALELARYYELRADHQRRRRASAELLGVGLCLYIEPCGRGWESARVSREPDGRIVVAAGTSSQGQGHQTTFAQIAAECLQVPVTAVEVVEGDTANTPDGVGALASRSTAIGGSAVRAAAEALRERLRSATGGAQTRVEANVVYTAPAEAWGSGCCIAVVAIDRDTGELRVRHLFSVEDCGVVINPVLFKGQLVGGLAQGIGQTLRERIVYDADGQLLSGSLLDYALPRADEMPKMETRSISTLTRANLLGAKGIGETGCIAAPAAILNAAYDALSAVPDCHLELPLTSESIWRALNSRTTRPVHA
ncbi:MAG: xanthine dehydrogenase family protein molybdopterin-binding subunit [Gammaproteobacteria bacterium]